MNRADQGILAVAGISLVHRVAYLAAQPATDPTFGRPMLDGAIYAEWAARIGWTSAGVDGAFYLAPGYAFLLAAFRAPTGDIPWALVFLVQHLAWVAAAVVVGRFVARTSGTVAGIGAAALLTYAPGAIYFASRPVGESVSIALALVAWTQVERRDVRGGALAGVLIGLACLARPNLLLLPAGWFVLLALQRRRRTAVVLAMVTGLSLAPVALRNLAASGHLVPVSSNAGLTLYHGNGPGAEGVYTRAAEFTGDPRTQRVEATSLARQRAGAPLDDVDADRWWGRRAVATRRADPAGTIALVLRRAHLTLASVEFALEGHPELDRNPFRPTWRSPLREGGWVPLAALLALAALGAARRRGRGSLFLLWSIAACAAVPLIFYVSSRYRLPAVAFLAVAAGHGLGTVAALPRPDWLRTRALTASAVALLLAGLSLTVPVDDLRRQQRAVALGNLAATLDAAGRTDLALERIDRAIALSPRDPNLLFNRARFYQKSGDPVTAERLYREVLGIDPFHAAAATNLGSLMLAGARTDGLVPLYEGIVVRQPAARGCWINLALVHAVRRDWGAARRTVDRGRRAGIEFDPEMVRMIESEEF